MQGGGVQTPLPPTPLDPRMYTVSSVIFLHCINVGILKSKPLYKPYLCTQNSSLITNWIKNKTNRTPELLASYSILLQLIFL